MPDPYRIDTIIDRFLEYVRQNRKVSLKDTASVLGLTVERAEQIATLLESNDLIEMRYGLTEIMLLSKQKQPQGEATKSNEKETSKSRAIEQSKELEREVLTAEGLLKFFEKDIERRIAKAEHLISDIEHQDKLSASDLEEIKHEVQLALNQLAAFSHELKGLSEKEEKFYEELTKFKKKLDGIKPGKIAKETTAPVAAGLPGKIKKLLQQIINFVKSVSQAMSKHMRAAAMQTKKLSKLKINKKEQKQAKQYSKKRLTSSKQPAITFLGHGLDVFKQHAEKVNVKAKTRKLNKRKSKRILETRVDKIRQHYWRKRA